MLLRFAVSNYRSFDEEQEMSMVASSLKDATTAVIEVPAVKEGALRVAAIYGANASGKSNALRAMQFVCSAVENSQTGWKPQQRISRHPFRMRALRAEQPTTFRVDFVVNAIRYEYKFSADSDSILEESLYSYPEARPRLLFSRIGEEFRFGKFISGPNQRIKDLTRSNSLFLSAAAQNNHEDLLPVYRWFADAVHFLPGVREDLNGATLEICADVLRKPLLERFLTAADLGLAGIDFQERDLPDETRKFFQALTAAVPDAAERLHVPDRVPDVAFLHRCETGEPVRLGWGDESSGTLAYFGLLGPVIEALERGSLLCIDEFDKSLHPLLALEIVRMFNDEVRNPKGAQLIFNTHDTNLLDSDVLRRDQIWFTEKDECGATHLYPLTHFRPRREENLERGYLQGRYGGVPLLRRESFAAMMRRRVDRVADGE